MRSLAIEHQIEINWNLSNNETDEEFHKKTQSLFWS